MRVDKETVQVQAHRRSDKVEFAALAEPGLVAAAAAAAQMVFVTGCMVYAKVHRAAAGMNKVSY